MGEDFANEVIDTRQARKTALWTYAVLQIRFENEKDLDF